MRTVFKTRSRLHGNTGYPVCTVPRRPKTLLLYWATETSVFTTIFLVLISQSVFAGELLAGETEMPSISSYYQTKPVPTKDSETVPAAAKRSLTNSKLKRKSFDGMDSIGSEPKPKALKREETNKVPTVISQSKDRLPTIDFRTKLNKTNGSRSFCGAQTLTRKSTDVSQFVSSNLASKSLNDFLISQDKLSTRLVDDPVKEKIREAIEKIVKEKLDSMLDEIIDECFLSVAATLSSS